MICMSLLFLCIVFTCLFFFFKQKTAYEMRISDWSSDVCSSDLDHRRVDRERDRADAHLLWLDDPFAADLPGGRDGALLDRVAVPGRSEEHTSELQSLMRISYAVFCLKKKTTTNPNYAM